jgi:hypothetical protein
MSSLPLKVFVAAMAAAFAFASHAETTNTRKHKKHASASATSRADSQHRGTDKFPAGPLYFSGVYLGDDPPARTPAMLRLGPRFSPLVAVQKPAGAWRVVDSQQPHCGRKLAQ